MRTIRFVVLLAALFTGCGRTSPAPATTSSTESRTPSPESRKYLLERVDDAAVVQLYADGFDALPLREKTLIWHLYQAALAGRDIFYDQKHRDALEMRGVLEQIVAHPQGIDPATLERDPALHQAVLDQQRPLQQPHRAQVRAQDCTPEAFAAAAQGRAGAGATFPTQNGESLDATARRGCSRCSSTRTSTRSSRTRRRRRARTS